MPITSFRQTTGGLDSLRRENSRLRRLLAEEEARVTAVTQRAESAEKLLQDTHALLHRTQQTLDATSELYQDIASYFDTPIQSEP